MPTFPTFSDMFWPTFAALVAWSVLMEIYHIGLSWWAAQKQLKQMQAMEQHYATMGVDPNSMPWGVPPGYMPIVMSQGVSGEVPTGKSTDEVKAPETGQYL